MAHHCCYFFFFFNDTATTEIYTLSLHDALPIYRSNGHPSHSDARQAKLQRPFLRPHVGAVRKRVRKDRKSTRLNSSHSQISYAVFCLKKKKTASGPRVAETTALGHDHAATRDR